MFLEKPAFPVSVEIGSAEEEASRFLDVRGWTGYHFNKVSIQYIPYYLFSYDIYDEINGKTIVISKGRGAFNSNKTELEDNPGVLLLDIGKSGNEISHNYEYEVLKPKLSEKEAREIISIRLAAEKDASKKNVLLSGLEMLYAPIWVLNFSLSGKDYKMKMNATSGEILNPEIIQARRKTQNEVAMEAISEISDPANWPSYAIDTISEIFEAIGKFFARQGKKAHARTIELRPSTFNNRDWLVIALGIIAIIVVLYVLKRF